ncbi:Crp/Fnr family transcriptional regulator [Pseudoalteromonas spongiae]|uniref:Crp/Fnr family transcriptional regulator n=1 Tax=Pseudoalteromonas spongiae TaxID=298657 RepID=UPI00110B1517|nr:Crp/Fnr family transcriptional regulator [Pseudoalteromonas spongiae]TMO83578.1 hypothetical protein CWC15_14925 [Pseudoalteromonas spongiae]
MNLEEFITKYGVAQSLEKGQHVFYQGDSSNCLYFVKSGLLKAYYLSDDGKETIKSFIQCNNVIGSISAVTANTHCTFNLIALAPSELIRFNFNDLQHCIAQSHTLAQNVIAMLLNHSMKKEQREFEFLMLPAEERYTRFKEKEPELVNRLTQNDIAKYLGITPVALSRIKHRTTGV